MSGLIYAMTAFIVESPITDTMVVLVVQRDDVLTLYSYTVGAWNSTAVLEVDDHCSLPHLY